MIKFMLVILLSFSVGCSVIPNNETETIAAAYLTIDTLAQSIGSAQLSGLITVEQEDDYLDRLESALGYLRLARSVDTDSSAAYLQLSLDILTKLQGEIGK